MIKEGVISRGQFLIEGLACRTTNVAEMNPKTGKIGPTVQRYFQEGIREKSAYPLHKELTYCLYTDYESDHQGAYTYVIGHGVEAPSDPSQGLCVVEVPPQRYCVFKNGPGLMPQVCIEAWQQIWQMSSQDFGGTRGYKADFEVYRGPLFGKDLTTVSLYIGIETS